MTARYQNALNQIPPPGQGCHTSLLSVANHGLFAGVDPEVLFNDIKSAIPPGTRRVPDREIRDAINKALADHHQGGFIPKPRPVSLVKDGPAAFRQLIAGAEIKTLADLWESSPVRLLDDPQGDPVLLLRSLFADDDLVFVGERHQPGVLGDSIRRAEDWIAYFRAGGKPFPHILMNPLSGRPMPTQSGNAMTYRGNNNIAAYRYALVEFDGAEIEDQVGFFTTLKLPVVVLIHSGRRSIHGWVDIQKLAPVSTSEEWATEIKDRLYGKWLVHLGVDSACSNPARLSRLPGFLRDGQYQKILWLRGRHNGNN